MSNGAVLCRPPRPVTMTRNASRSTAASPAPWHPSSDSHVVVETWPNASSVTSPSPRPRWCRNKQQQPDLPFLRSCAMCRRRLSSDRDIYIYRGDIGFCSPECRERRIRLDDDEADEKHYYY